MLGPKNISSGSNQTIDLFFFGFAGLNFDTEDGDKVIPGFLDSIIGIQRGETKSFPLVFPESWKQENLCGVHAQFTVGFFVFLLFICNWTYRCFSFVHF